MNIKVGSWVKVVDENTEGEVVAIGHRIVVLVDGLQFTYQPKELILLDSSVELTDLYNNHLPNSTAIKAEDAPKLKKPTSNENSVELGKVRGKRNSKNVLEFDLHIHDLLVKSSHMTSGEKLNYQLDYAVNCLEASIKKKEPAVIFIHGVGKGVLKMELHKIIRAYGFDFQDGFMQEYGMGATRVEMRGAF